MVTKPMHEATVRAWRFRQLVRERPTPQKAIMKTQKAEVVKDIPAEGPKGHKEPKDTFRKAQKAKMKAPKAKMEAQKLK